MERQVDRKYSHSSMKTYRRCRQRYFWSYIENLEPLPSGGLIRGSVGHHSLATWYSTKNREEAIEAASEKLAEYEDLLGQTLQSDWDLMQLVLDRYFDWSEVNDDFVVSVTEQKFELELEGFTLIGYIDGIAQTFDGVLWLLEHKFQKQARTKHLALDPQSSMYLWAARKMGYNVRGIMYNIIRVAPGGIAEREPVVRNLVYRNNEGLQFIEDEMLRQMDEMDQFHLGNVPVFRTPTQDCSWDCGFYDVCLSINDDGSSEALLGRIPIKVFRHETEGEDE